MKRKIISFVLIFSLITPYQLLAVDLGTLFNGTSVSTDFGTWNSPRSGAKYFYGGSYRFAFKGAGRAQPLFQGQPPSMKVGCNGFSLSGGFLALLGIPEIKQLLSSAGASLAWGLMMGLEYSMPGLAKVFATLRQWAREIQQLLGNMCNLGQMLGDRIGSNEAMKSVTHDLTGNMDQTFQNLNDGMTRFHDSVKTSLFGSVGINKCEDTYASGSPANQKCINKLGQIVSIIASPLTKTSALSLLSMAIGGSARASITGDPANKIYISKLSSFLNTGKIGSKLIIANATELDTIKSSVLLGRLFYGDLRTPSEAIQEILRFADDGSISGGVFTEGDYAINAQKAIDGLASAKKPADYGMMPIPATIESSENIAKMLIDGISANTQIDNCDNTGTCSIPDTYVVFVDLAKNTDANASSEANRFISNITNDQTTNATLTIKWEGGYIESLRVIRAMVQQLSGHNPTFITANETSVSVKASNAIDIKVPLLLPNIQKYMISIATLEKRAKGETPYTAQLKSILARYNAYFFATSMNDLIAGRTLDALGAKGDPLGIPDYKELRDFLDHLNLVKKEVEAKIKDDMKNQISYKELAETFENVEKQLKQDLMKDY